MSNQKEHLKLIKWYNDHYPPIDLNKEQRHVRELILEVLKLRDKVEQLKCELCEAELRRN